MMTHYVGDDCPDGHQDEGGALMTEPEDPIAEARRLLADVGAKRLTDSEETAETALRLLVALCEHLEAAERGSDCPTYTHHHCLGHFGPHSCPSLFTDDMGGTRCSLRGHRAFECHGEAPAE